VNCNVSSRIRCGLDHKYTEDWLRELNRNCLENCGGLGSFLIASKNTNIVCHSH
jgi:hypothetical protein